MNSEIGLEAILFLSVLIVALLDRLRHRFWIFSLFALPSTVLHESMHFGMALITNGKPAGFSVLPHREGNSYHLGHVLSRNFTWYNRGLISLAPLLLIPLAWACLAWLPERTELMVGAAWAYLFGSMLYGSLPSTTDWQSAWAAPIITATIIAGMLFGIYTTLGPIKNITAVAKKPQSPVQANHKKSH